MTKTHDSVAKMRFFGGKPAWIVDGQQRALALTKCKRRDLPIPINAFVADEVELQRDQFLRVNSAKPLPRGLITELLPEVSSNLPANLSAKKMPSAICDWLNREKSSPFYGLVHRASTSKEDKSNTVIADNSIVKMVEESLSQPSGCLFPYRNIATGETDFDGITTLLVVYWSAVREVFPDAWGKPATKSRLMHGAGIRSMGRLMDSIMPNIDARKPTAKADVIRELKLIAPICRWTSGRWEEMDDIKWNDITHTRMRQRIRLRVAVGRMALLIRSVQNSNSILYYCHNASQKNLRASYAKGVTLVGVNRLIIAVRREKTLTIHSQQKRKSQPENGATKCHE